MITYSRARPDDIPTVVNLYKHCFVPLFKRIRRKLPSDAALCDVLRLYWDSGIFLVARERRRVLGFIIGTRGLTKQWGALFSRKWFWKAWKFLLTERVRFITPPALHHLFYGSHLFAEGVHSDFRGQGVGSELARCVLEELEKLGAKRIYFEALADNASIIRIYEGLGFEKRRDFRAYGVNWVLLKKACAKCTKL